MCKQDIELKQVFRLHVNVQCICSKPTYAAAKEA